MIALFSNYSDEIFMPKPENELEGIVDEFDRELEEFKRLVWKLFTTLMPHSNTEEK